MNLKSLRLWMWQILTGSRMKALLIEGESQFNAGHNVQALEMYREAVRQWPTKPDGYIGMGKTYQAMGLRPEAARENTIADSLIALDNDPEDMTAKINLARALHEKGMYGWAAAHIDQALTKVKKDMDIFALGSEIFRSNRNFSKASDVLRRMIQFDPLNPDHYEKLALCLNRIGQTSEAMVFLSIGKALSAAEKNPSNIEAVEQAVRHFMAAGRKEPALILINKCIEASPVSNGLFRMQGELLLSERRLDEALESLRTAVSHDPTDLKAHRMLGNIYQLKGETRLSKQHKNLALAMEKASRGGDPVAKEMVMIQLLLKSDKHDMAKQRIAELIESHPHDWRGPFLTGIVLKNDEKTRQALESFQKARRMDVNAPEPHIEIARIHSEMGDMIGAVAEARQAVTLSPRDPDVRKALAAILRSHGYMDQAIEEEELAESLIKKNNGHS